MTIISNDGNFKAKYWHLNKFPDNFKKNDPVSLGQVIGEVGVSGNAGNTDQPHLHFQLEMKDPTTGNFSPVDPGGCINAHFF